MAETSYGVNDALAVKLWSRKLFQEALKETYIDRFIGTSSNSLIVRKDETSKSAGDKITYGLRMQLTGDGIQGDAILEGNEESLTTYSDSLYINQLRHAVKSAGKMSEQRVPFSVREEAMSGLKDWLADKMDTGFIYQIAGYSDQTDTRYTGNNTAVAPTASTRILVTEAGSTTESQLDSNDLFDLTYIDKAVTVAKTATPFIRPVRVGGKDKYVLFLHPYQVRDLRISTTTGQWLDIQKAAMQGGKIGDNPIFTGALGVYNNTILVENPRMPTVVANTRRAVFFGAQAGVFAVGQDNSPEKMSWVEELFDYENQLGVSAGMIFGAKKTIFNSVDFGTIVLSTYATAP